MFDFTSVYDRKCDGSIKWSALSEECNCGCLDCFPLGMADMEFQSCPALKEGLIAYVKDHVLGYTMETQAYLETISNYLSERFEFKIEPDWLLTTPGVVAAFSAGIRALTKKGEGVIVFSPVYNPFYEQIEENERTLIKCPMYIEDGKYQIDFEKFEALASQAENTLLIFCSPHNPGGRVWTREELKRVADICLQHDLYVISDEIHGDLALNGHKHLMFPAGNENIADRAIICSAASKAYNIAGLQCSNVIIPNAMIRTKFEAALHACGIQQANALGLKATEISYRDCQDWLDEVKTVIETNHQLVKDFFTEWDDRWQVMEQEASFMAWISYKDFDINHADMMALLHDKCHFYVNDGAMYGPEAEGWIRLNVGLPTEKLRDLLSRFKEKMADQLK